MKQQVNQGKRDTKPGLQWSERSYTDFSCWFWRIISCTVTGTLNGTFMIHLPVILQLFQVLLGKWLSSFIGVISV